MAWGLLRLEEPMNRDSVMSRDSVALISVSRVTRCHGSSTHSWCNLLLKVVERHCSSTAYSRSLKGCRQRSMRNKHLIELCTVARSGCGVRWLHDVPNVGSPHLRCGAVRPIVPHLIDYICVSIRSLGCCQLTGDVVRMVVVRGT